MSIESPVISSSLFLENVLVQSDSPTGSDTLCQSVPEEPGIPIYNILNAPEPHQNTWMSIFFIPRRKDCYVFAMP